MSSELLTVVDLPAGWTDDTSPDSSSSSGEPDCLKNLDKLTTAPDEAKAQFVSGSTLSALFLAEDLDRWPTEATARSVFTTAKSTLDGCHSFSGTDDSGTTITGTVAPMALPAYGDQSAAWRFDAKVQGVSFTFLAIVVRKGATHVAVLLGGLANPDAAFLSRVLPAALAKVT